ncbi:hypothetical protein WME89_13475 [Sorangium sp. So ce321]|uniref:hypothetical protein n=1 Tax=Sorangium sp. So ce321 TaxID=3133300 RepID=UPI003F5DEF2D
MPVERALPSAEAGLGELLSGPDGGILTALLGVTSVVLVLCLLLVYRRWPVLSVIPIFMGSVLLTALGAFLVRPAVVLPYLRLAAALSVPLEILVAGWVVYVVLRARRSFRTAGADGDFHERTLAAVRAAAGNSRLSDIVATEVSLLYHALFSWRARPVAAPGQTLHPYRREAGYGVALPVLLMVIAIETTIVHVLLSGFYPPVKWALMVAGLYAMLWIVADHRATAVRPMLLDRDALRVRAGLRRSARIPLSSIAAVRCLSAAPPRGTPGYVNLVLFGRPRMLVELKEPTRLEGPYGTTRQGQSLGISVDDWPAFQRALSGFGVAFEGEHESTSDDVFDRLREGLRSSLRSTTAADLLARELSLLACAFFFFWLAPSAPASGEAFTVHRKSGYGAVLGVLLLLALGELAAVHLILHDTSAVASNVLLALSVYGIVWLFGDYQALRLRRVLVVRGMLLVRVGLRAEVRVSLKDVEAIERLPASGEPDRRSGYVRCTAMGAPELLIRLRRPVEAEGMFRRSRKVTCIGITVDDEAKFIRAVEARRDLEPGGGAPMHPPAAPCPI